MDNVWSKTTDVWFDPLAEASAELAHMPSIKQANAILQRIPNKRNLLILIALIENSLVKFVAQENAWKKVLEQARAIIAGDFKDKFRFRYNRISRIKGQCSATSELFSLLRQAITYHSSESA